MRTSGLIGAIAFLWMGCVDAVDEEQSVEPLQTAPFFGGDLANHALFASDVSFWETPLAQSEMDCFWDSGVRHVIVGTQVRLDRARAARDGGGARDDRRRVRLPVLGQGRRCRRSRPRSR